MKKPVPKCHECRYCQKEPIVGGGSLHDFCYHPVWEYDLFPFKWIKSTAKRKSSPKWCPLREKKGS